ncbi:MAG TPA: hypothetical protein IAB00_01520 [Candidatus Avidehalobacter gallistercoris]|uniref:Uncharacterized protein n=1 Tax=Candidatus Avidehalobacter gallistercoris TaxID=2840694 RepID=A0A9D1HIV9_9FIRM|nr:hypothetical protein [Candidatus Avidehalobacter gallistercoris]
MAMVMCFGLSVPALASNTDEFGKVMPEDIINAIKIFFYEQTADSPIQAKMDVILLSEDDKNEMQKMYAQKLLNEIPVPYSSHGYYAKMYINNTNRNYSSCSITLPDSSKISVSSGSNLFLYGGFSSSVEADLGLQYSTQYDVWKCFMTISGSGYFLANRDEATWQNGYLPETTVSIVCIPYNASTNIDNSGYGTVGTVVLKAYGLAKHKTQDGQGGSTSLTSVMESNTVFNLTKVNTHKWVTSIGGSANSTGYNIGVFKDITINGIIQPSSNFKTDDSDGLYTFSNKGNGTITMTIKN